ncbi:MAG: hypothetical protein FWD60_09275 [Candidatus Azobacteroides sp.]|nr:hypothetical protein [Candidatus Azobacteroides sp.]
MKKKVKDVPSPQEGEKEHDEKMKDLRQQIDHAKQVLNGNPELSDDKDLLLD